MTPSEADDATQGSVAGDATREDLAARDQVVRDRFQQMRATGDRQLRDELVVEHRWIAEQAARRLSHRGEPYDDLLQVAMFGLFKAVERFDPDHGAAFPAFATPTVLGELRRHFRDATWSLRVPRRLKDLHVRIPGAVEELSAAFGRAPTPAELSERLDVSEDEVLEALDAGAAYRAASLDQPAPGGDSPGIVVPTDDAGVERAEHRTLLGELLAELPERERTIVFLRFFEELSQAEIAERVGMSQVHVSRLLRSSIQMMRERADLDPGDLSPLLDD
ncbi:MAG TPA: SigB/SigF/SigG family RNA polymerase sigma factor [Microthrixaceae bacterium]|nr:SigB/SigF/SigG family RNA polymerase sigma factor [Microthrixaceae bacterium]